MLTGIVLCISLSAQDILFVGNSLTYSNELPAILSDIGKAMGQKIKTECLCKPNYGLEDHWKEEVVQERISSKQLEFVVFQQGPSSQAYGRQSLLEYGGKISEYANEHGTKPAYFMVWPSLQYYSTFDGVIKNHRDASTENKALLIPLGELWRKYRTEKNHTNLYGYDGFHPSKAGSLLAALSIYKTLFPDNDLASLKYRKFSQLTDRADFERMIELVNQ